MQPLQFQPILKRIRWGNRRLGTVLGKPIGPESDYAESWEIVDHGVDQSIVTDGEYRGWQLRQLVTERAEALFGPDRSAAQFPLLLKFIDAADRLSVQVHPSDEQARQMGLGDNGKTEAWYILDAAAGSRVYAGLKDGVGRTELERALDSGTVEECLHAVEVRAGDCIFVPAGTVHAIGEGILLTEIQQSSDVTFRLFDWNRLDTNGKPRPLHRDEALACIDFSRGPVNPVAACQVAGAGRSEELVCCDQFALVRRTIDQPTQLSRENRFRIVLPIRGTVELRRKDDSSKLRLGDSTLIPAASLRESPPWLNPSGTAVTLEAYVP